jgi:hypothetical protein
MGRSYRRTAKPNDEKVFAALSDAGCGANHFAASGDLDSFSAAKNNFGREIGRAVLSVPG